MEATMFNLPTRMRREIAARPEMEDRAIKYMLKMEPEPLQQLLDEMGNKLEQRGFGPSVIVAYQALGPLLRENRAVMAYRAQTGNSETANALPDLANVTEAVDLATLEWHLDDKEQQQLQELLTPLAP